MKDKRTWRKQWRLWRLGAVERYYFELKENSTYPFDDLGDGFYYILITSDKFAFGIGTLIIAILCFSLFSHIIGMFSFPFVLFLVVSGYGIFCLYGNSATKELIVSRYGGYLLRIKGSGKVLVEEPINNVYIKLQRKYDTNMLPHYYLILGGYRLDDIRLTGFSMNDSPLRILGSGVAGRMGLNFFDVDNNSKLHKILHYPGRSVISPPEDEFARFLKVHDITHEEIAFAQKLEKLSAKSIYAPTMIMNRIKANYGGYHTDEAATRDKSGRRKSRVGTGTIPTTTQPKIRETLQTLLTWEHEKEKKQKLLQKTLKSLLTIKK